MKSWLALLVVVSACSARHPRISPDVSTRDIAVAVRMDSTTGGLLQATLVGTSGDVVLLPPDRLVIAQNGREWPMARASTGYVTDIEGATGRLHFRLDRRDDESVNVGFAIPAPFTIVTPNAVSRAASMTFTWDGQIPFAQTSFSITGDCIAPLGRMLGIDTGTYTLNPAEIQEVGLLSQSCEAKLTITRKVAGGGASVLRGFSSDFTVSSTTTFTSTSTR